MATDFNKNVIVVSGGIKPASKNTPMDIRTRIQTIGDVESIPMPFVGMIFFVIDEAEYYKVLSLKAKSMAGMLIEDALVDEYEKLIDVSGLASEEFVNEAIRTVELTPGPKGEQGDIGPQGPQGLQGEKGEQGETGPQGLPGIDGKSAYQIAVEKGFDGGDEEAWLASLKGETGEQGPAGQDGAKGDQGEIGPQGLPGVDGKSAYQIAVDGGFIGEQEAWLESLKGPQGEKGVDGTFDDSTEFEILNTENKTVLGAINELLALIKEQIPGLPEDVLMYYGYIPYEVTGSISSYDEITYEMIKNPSSVITEAKPSKLGRTSVGDIIPEASFMYIAVPSVCKFTVTKDNGFGGKVNFNTTDAMGANGIDVMLNGTAYKVYGELILVSGERFMYID